MAHWSKGISDTNLLLRKQYSFSDTIDREDRLVEGHLHVAKSSSPVMNTHKRGSNESFYSHQSAEYLIAEKSRLEEDPVSHKRAKLPEADKVVSNSLCLHKFPNSSMHRESNKKCSSLNLEDVSSKEEHFPMLESWKTQKILISKRGAGCTPSGRMTCELSQPELLHRGTGQSRLTNLAIGGYFQPNKISEAIKDSPISLEDCMGPNAGDLFKREMSNVEIQNHAKENLGSSSSDYKLKHKAIAEFPSCKLGFGNISGPSTSRFASQMKNIDNTNSDIGARSSFSQGRSMRKNIVSSSDLGGLNDHVRVHQSVNKIHSCSVRNVESLSSVESLRMVGVSNYMENIERESEKLSTSFHYPLSTKKVDTESSQREKQFAISEETTNGKSSSVLNEMFTIPNTSEGHSKKHGLSQVLKSSSCSRDGGEPGRSIPHMMGASKSSPVRIASMSTHDREKQIPLGGTNFHEPPRKVLQFLRNSRLIKSYAPLAPMVKQGANKEAETDIFDTDLCCQKQNLNQILFCAQKPIETDAGGGAAGSSIEADAGEGWLKRRKHEHSDSHCCSFKKSRNGNGPLTGEASVIDYTAYTPDTSKTAPDAFLKESKIWVGRWCCKDSQVASAQEKLAKAESSNPGNSKLLPNYSEARKFPRVGAMALIGKVMNNLQTCEYQKKGSSTVWNVQEL